MSELNIRTASELADYVRQRNLDYVKVGVFDVDGVLRGKYMGRDKFLSVARKGLRLLRRGARLGLATTSSTTTSTFTGWHTAYPDAAGARRCPDDLPRHLPSRTTRRSSSANSPARAEAVCPRGTLRRVLQRAATWASTVSARRRIRVLHVRGDAAFRPREELSQPRRTDAGLLRLFGAARRRARRALSRTARHVPRRWTWRSRACTPRPGPACSRRRSCYSEALEAADKAALFKTFTKVLAQRRG